ncbi:MAG: restriction endonuclease subunit S [Archaeoglobaceae archaeon]
MEFEERREVNNIDGNHENREVRGPYELPEGWRWVELKELVSEDRRQINPQESYDRDFWLVTMDCVESNTGNLLQKVIVKGKDVKSVKFKFNSHHILYGKLRPYLNKVYLPDDEGICTTEFIPLLPKPNVDRGYLASYLRTHYVVNYAMKNLTGARQPRVSLDTFFMLPVPLPFKNNEPDLEEQKRIVARIEELFGKIERIRKLRERAKEEAKLLLDSALHHVFSKADEKGWRWVKIKNLVQEVKSGFACSKSYERGEGIPHLRPHNISIGRLDLNKVVHLPPELVDFENYSLRKGDILSTIQTAKN